MGLQVLARIAHAVLTGCQVARRSSSSGTATDRRCCPSTSVASGLWLRERFPAYRAARAGSRVDPLQVTVDDQSIRSVRGSRLMVGCESSTDRRGRRATTHEPRRADRHGAKVRRDRVSSTLPSWSPRSTRWSTRSDELRRRANPSSLPARRRRLGEPGRRGARGTLPADRLHEGAYVPAQFRTVPCATLFSPCDDHTTFESRAGVVLYQITDADPPNWLGGSAA